MQIDRCFGSNHSPRCRNDRSRSAMRQPPWQCRPVVSCLHATCSLNVLVGVEEKARLGSLRPTLIMTAKLNDADPLAWLADVLARIAGQPQSRLYELLPWEWKQPRLQKAA